MPSQLKQAIKDLKAKVLTEPAFVYCAVFNNQVKEEEAGKTFVFPKPAVLIEISNPTSGVQLLGTGVTVNDFVFRFSIVHEQLNAEYDGNSGTGMDENLDVFDLRDKLKTLLTGFQPTNCSALQYDEESQDYAHENVYVYGISFKTAYVDTKGSPFDSDSTVWQEAMIDNLNFNAVFKWQSGINYAGGKSIVGFEDEIYLCTVDNNDTEFTPANWLLIQSWTGLTTYVIGDYIAYAGHIYQCNTNNNDADFTYSNWTRIF